MKKYLLQALNPILLVAIISNFFSIQHAFIGLICTCLFFVSLSLAFGATLQPKKSLLAQFLTGLLTQSAILITILTATFYITTLTPTLVFCIFTSISALILLYSFNGISHIKLEHSHINETSAYLHVAGFSLIAALLLFAYKSGSIHEITSIWHQLPLFFLPLFAVLIALTGYIIARHANTVTPFLTSGIFFLIATLPHLVYRLGFGFDTFIHQATEKLLLESGTITPQPLYYIGHYIVVYLGNILTNLSVSALDTLFVVCLLSILPLVLFTTTQDRSPKTANWYAFALLALPLSLFINPTPQATSLVLALITLFYTLQYSHDRSTPTITLLALFLATFCIHPLSAIAIAFPIGLILINAHHNRIATLTSGVIASFLFPLAFLAANSFSPNQVAFHLSFDTLATLPHAFTTLARFPLDTLYGFANAIYILIPGSLIIAMWYVYTNSHKQLYPAITAYISLALGWILTATLLNFTSLNVSDSSDFTNRLRDMSLIFTLPIFVTFFFESTLLNHKNKYFHSLLVIGSLIFTTSALYIAFPRYDNYATGNFKNLTASDVSAVHAIANLHKEPYVVLANQMTSAAALREFGFNHNITTVNGDAIYFYPIPTGQQLHELFINTLISAEPQEEIVKVKLFTQTKKVLLVLPKYWNNFDAINERLSAISMSKQNIGNVVIFEF